MHVVITGGNRGIGLGLVRRYLEGGHSVHATARRPAEATDLKELAAAHTGRLEVAALDVDDDANVAAWGRSLVEPVDVVINNAGISGPPAPCLRDCDFAAGHQVLATNAFGPLRVAAAVFERLRRPGGKLVNISSLMGSVGDNASGGAYFYRMSKSALNMASRCLGIEWRAAQVIVAVVHPGWVQTRMGGAGAPVTVDASCAGIARVVENLGADDSGQFFNFDGRPLAW